MTKLGKLASLLTVHLMAIAVYTNTSYASLIERQKFYEFDTEAEPKNETNASRLRDHVEVQNGDEFSKFESNLKLATKIQLKKSLYNLLNQEFAELLKVSPEEQTRFLLEEKTTGLSESQILALLLDQPDIAEMLSGVLQKIGLAELDKEEVKLIKNRLIFLKQTQKDLFLKLSALANPSTALKITRENNLPAISKVDFFVNHPRLIADKSGGRKVLPPDNLKQVVLDFISGSQQSISGNFYEFDLQDVAFAFVDASKRGVNVTVGVDHEAMMVNPKIMAVANIMEPSKAKLIAVKTPGLNHMKILVRDPGLPTAAVLVSSGNLTQSCIGPEGDLGDIPESLRPATSIPNANHTIIVHGELPAIIAQHQLDKILNMELFGQKGFPFSGAYKFFKSDKRGKAGYEWMIMAFSPNGGNGDINNDILKQVILSVDGRIGFLQFAFSSPTVLEALEVANQRQKQQGKKLEFFGLGDKTFAMREFSVFIKMVGLERDLNTKRYSEVPNSFTQTLSTEELKSIRKSIYVAPPMYGESHYQINGQSMKTTGKIHHKVMMIPDWEITVAGTSFNFSKNAEQNNEQIVIFRDRLISEQMMASYAWLASNSKFTVFREAARRNTFKITDDESSDPDSLEDDAATELTNDSQQALTPVRPQDNP